MANYYQETANAMNSIRDMFALVRVLREEKDRINKRYAPDVAAPMIDDLNARYKAANNQARQAVKDAIQAAHARIDKAQSEMLRLGNAEEDFKLLALPVILSRDELRVMVKRNEGNALFARAVSQYAKDHKYDDDPYFRMLGNTTPFGDDHRNIDEAGKRLMKYCEEDRLDAVISNDWRESAFSKVDEMGLFENL